MKTCKECNKTLTLDNFYKYNDRGKIYYRRSCIECYNLQTQKIKKKRYEELKRKKIRTCIICKQTKNYSDFGSYNDKLITKICNECTTKITKSNSKFCMKCKEIKNLSDFYKFNKLLYKKFCKQCTILQNSKKCVSCNKTLSIDKFPKRNDKSYKKTCISCLEKSKKKYSQNKKTTRFSITELLEKEGIKNEK